MFLADKLLRDLERDFCEDLLIDSNDALLWLEYTNDSLDHNIKRHLRAFSFDYKSLYDSLKPELVIEALEVAMEEQREEWSDDLKKWIIDLVNLSLKSSVGQYEDNFYIQKNGVPTGGTLCVQLANMTVYYIMRKEVYHNEPLMSKITAIKRFIDDGSGFFSGTKRQFSEWITKINQLLFKYGLNIDEYTITDFNEFVAFLDIQFRFNANGRLETDLYRKPTDSRSYLQFGSAHPNHVYSSIVYSQCIRLRRIINCDDRLKMRIDELKLAFMDSHYPKKMVDNISNKVLKMERKLPKPHNSSNSSVVVPASTPSPKSIRMISTFGSDSDLLNVVRTFEPAFTSSPSFASNPDLASSTPENKLFKFVKRTGSSLRNKLVKTKHMALNIRKCKTLPCNKKNCQCCQIISDLDSFNINGQIIKPAAGSCTTYNIIYCFICKICQKCYVGRSVQQLNQRVGQHRRNYYDVLRDVNVARASQSNQNKNEDEYSLALHLVEDHKLFNKSDFSEVYRVFILDTCSPKILEIQEHRYIHKLRTVKPHGINSVDPFGIPLLKF